MVVAVVWCIVRANSSALPNPARRLAWALVHRNLELAKVRCLTTLVGLCIPNASESRCSSANPTRVPSVVGEKGKCGEIARRISAPLVGPLEG